MLRVPFINPDASRYSAPEQIPLACHRGSPAILPGLALARSISRAGLGRLRSRDTFEAAEKWSEKRENIYSIDSLRSAARGVASALQVHQPMNEPRCKDALGSQRIERALDSPLSFPLPCRACFLLCARAPLMTN